METKYCKHCRLDKPIDAFYHAVNNGRRRPKTYCKVCENRQREERRRLAGKVCDERSRRYKAKISRMRKAGEDVARWILTDSRRSDKKSGYEHNLTKEFIKEAIAAGCTYCGETNLRMTLDRIDNSKGHTQDNVRAACIRCNYIRRAMPYEAWVNIAASIRQTREKGLFGDWTGRCR